MRNTDCVKVQTIWIYISKWSGCTTNTFVICLPSREKCLNIQRECFMPPVVNPHYLPPFVTLGLEWAIWFSCGCLQDTSFLTSWFSVFMCIFVPSGVLWHCPSPNSVHYCTIPHNISKALAIAWTDFKLLCACSVGSSWIEDVCLQICLMCIYVTGFVSKDNVFSFLVRLGGLVGSIR